MVMAEKCNLSENGKISSDPDFMDIDCDYKDPQLCSLYASDIYSNLRVAEVCSLDTTFDVQKYFCLPFLICCSFTLV